MGRVTAIQDRLVLTLADVKAYLGITVTDFDDRITLALSSVKRLADDFCNNPFHEMVQVDPTFNEYYEPRHPLNDRSDGVPDLDADPVVEEPIPDQVKEGVLEYIRWTLQRQGVALGSTEEKVGDVSRKYELGDVTVTDIKDVYFRPFRLTPGF